jgi:hypothetical protein
MNLTLMAYGTQRPVRLRLGFEILFKDYVPTHPDQTTDPMSFA